MNSRIVVQQYPLIQFIKLPKIFAGIGTIIHFLTPYDNKLFSFSGRFSAVKKCIKKDASDQIFAAKIIKKRNLQHALNELCVFQLAHNHPNFIALHQVFDSPSEAIFILE